MVAYYNENEPFAAAWLRNLMAAGLIAPARRRPTRAGAPATNGNVPYGNALCAPQAEAFIRAYRELM